MPRKAKRFRRSRQSTIWDAYTDAEEPDLLVLQQLDDVRREIGNDKVMAKLLKRFMEEHLGMTLESE